jgi:hypothetical protein
MRMLLTFVALGLAASTAMGGTTIAMVDQATGSSDIDITKPGVAGSVRTINIVITTDEQPGLNAWGLNGLQPPAAGFLQTAQITTTNYLPGDAFNWDSTGALTTGKQSGAKAWPVLPGLSLGTTCYIDISVSPPDVWPATSGPAMNFTLTLPTDTAVRGAFTSKLQTGENGYYAGIVGAGNSVVTFVPLNITPEPVSALLLLAGLPMLRRRR